MPGSTHFAFPRQLRLLNGAAFQWVFDQPTRASAPELTLLARHNQFDHPRIGFVIARKQIKRAHERNRIKRITRDFIRLRQHQLPAIDLIVLAKKPCELMTNQELRDLLEGLCRTLTRRLPAS